MTSRHRRDACSAATGPSNPTHWLFPHTDYDNRTALHLGAAEGHLAAVKYLVARGADVNAVDRWRGTPLRDAEAGEHTETVAFCVEIATLSCWRRVDGVEAMIQQWRRRAATI